MYISITTDELRTKKLSPIHLEETIKAINEDGYVIIKDVIPHEPLDILKEKMGQDSEILIKSEKWGGAGHLHGHLQQGPPPFAPYVFSEIVANPFIIQVSKALFGEGIFNSFYNGNTNCPGSLKQPLHMDGKHLWPCLEVSHPPVSVVINISPIDTNEENGSVELWPSTHLIGGTPRPMTTEIEEARRQIIPPIRGNARKGSVLIRDVRLWHRGVPNQSSQMRHMIAMIHHIGWWRRGHALTFNRGSESAFLACDLDHNAVFTDEPVDYLFLQKKFR
ncbi:TPA: hypothetical protein EYN98_30220 [Candidatus Poribacteria bacterium]|jgi:hypothetical protein|nr:hypothetical protein [Candidatus Poribacteria bacterium]HIA70247.1 hypothetical protein [Candidatus Poribacteria bacterium]HIO50914.1 hypothetical protein [Candidatus Poribacteria bacterium]